MSRKWMAFLLSAILLLSLTTACGNQNDNNDRPSTDPTDAPGSSVPDNTMPETEPATMPQTDALPDMMEDDTFPGSLADADADVALDDLIATLGLTATDLKTALRDVSTVGDPVEGAHTYRHKMMGHDADVSYGYNDEDLIDRITVKAGKDRAEDWKTELNDMLNASPVDGQQDTWDYNDSRVKITEDGDHILITIEKPDK